jgi:hypothetical protein
MTNVPNIWLLIATPRVAATGAAVTVRLAGGGVQGYTQFASTDWKAGLDAPAAITQSLGFSEDGFGAGASVQALQMEWGGADSDAKSLAAYYWRDAGFSLYTGPDGAATGSMALVLSGKIADVLYSPARLTLQMADPAIDLAKPVLTATFAGTGGIEGDVEIKAQAKSRAWGSCFNVKLRSLLKASNIHVATDPSKPIQAFVQVYDRGNAASALTVVVWQGSIAATLAALIASVPAQGGASVAPSIACIKWWYATPGLLTCDIEGENVGGYVDRPADIAQRLVLIAGLTVDAPLLTAARTARDSVAGWLVEDPSATIATEIQALLSGVSLWWALSASGEVEFGEWAWTAPVASFKSERAPRAASYRPIQKAVIGWKRNNTVMARGDIAGSVFYSSDIVGAPTSLAAVNAVEGAKLTGIEPLATAGADVAINVKNSGTIIAKEQLLNSTIVLNADGTASYFNGVSTINIGAVTFAALPGKSLAALDAAANTKLGGIAPLADVTSAQAPTLSVPPSVNFTADHIGALTPPTQVPFSLSCARKVGETNVDMTTVWAATFPSAVTGTIDTTSNSVARGDITITAATGSGYLGDIVVTAARDGLTLQGKIAVYKNNAPMPTGGGSGASFASITSWSGTAGNTHSVIGFPVIVAAGSSGVISVSGAFSFQVPMAGNPDGSYGLAIKAQWRVIGGSWADIAAEVVASQQCGIYNEPPRYVDSGSIAINVSKTGLASGTDFEFQILGRGAGSNATVGSRTMTGTANVARG